MIDWNRDEAERMLRAFTRLPPLGSKIDNYLVRQIKASVEGGMREVQIRGLLGFDTTWTIGIIRPNPNAIVLIVTTSDGEVLFPTEVNFT